MEGVGLEQVRAWTRAAVRGPLPQVEPTGVSTDTRTLTRGDVFVALRGPSFDGHRFVAAALEGGACAAVVERGWAEGEGRGVAGPLLAVGSPLVALGQMAGAYRQRFHLPVIAVVGSAGKTTTKEMIAAVLGRRLRVLKTPGNENNEIGVPRTLLSLTARHQAVVVELAARKEGDIRYLCSLARPTLGVLLNIGTAHLEFFETVERVAKAKGELLDSFGDESSLALVNADDCVIAGEAKRTKGRLLGFGLTRGSHYSGEGLVLDQEGCGHFSLQHTSIDLQIPGRHNVYNALAAAAVGHACGLPWAEIQAALAAFRPVSMRSETLRKRGVCVINDCYNANPDSVRAALETLVSLRATPGRKVAVLADMLELGPRSAELHASIGRRAFELGVDLLVATGPMSASTVAGARGAGMGKDAALHFGEAMAMAAFVKSIVQEGDVVLVKASRGMALDRILDHIA
ncbi:MAG: UDP-N-acetylmuramoyl-tripeptide--D-alanyl-D-alanine ligase [Gemmatimonadota bacterium]